MIEAIKKWCIDVSKELCSETVEVQQAQFAMKLKKQMPVLSRH